MQLATEKEYTSAVSRLDFLLDNDRSKTEEIEQLVVAIDEYEKDNGHEPIDPDSLIYRIEREMHLRHLNKKQLAELLEITPSRLSEVLHGKREVNMDLAVRLYRKLSIPAEYILEHATRVLFTPADRPESTLRADISNHIAGSIIMVKSKEQEKKLKSTRRSEHA